MVADGKDVVAASSVDVASVGTPPGNISAVSALLSVSTTSIGRSTGPVSVRRTAGPQELVTPSPCSELLCVGGD